MIHDEVSDLRDGEEDETGLQEGAKISEEMKMEEKLNKSF